MHLRFGSFKRVPVALLAAALTATAAGAATVHRFSVSQTTGSEGAQTFLQSSASSSALQGEVGGTSANTMIKLPFGTLGEYDASTSTFGVGVLGISTSGYAVAGESLSGNPSVLGYAGGTGDGVDGDSPDAYGVQGVGGGGTFAAGVDGYATANGVKGGDGQLGLLSGTGVIAYGRSGSAMHPAIEADQIVNGSDLFGTFSIVDSGGGLSFPESFIVQSGSENRSGGTTPFYPGASDTQVSGDLYVYGHVFENCDQFPATVNTRCDDSDTGTTSGSEVVTRSAGGTNVKVYTPKQSVSTVEDFGQARLVNGRAYVDLDPAFARTTAPGAAYLVFVTPEGDSRGVFTANHTLSGFEVHENGGGRSTMIVDYRIVAKPLGDTSQRFLAIAPKHRIPGYNVRKRSEIEAVLRRHHESLPIAPLAISR